MKRWLFNIASTLSLLLCLASVAMWVRSYSVTDHVGWWIRRVEGKAYPFVAEDSSGLFFHQGTMFVVSATDRVLRADYHIAKRRRPVLMRNFGRITDPAANWPIELIVTSECNYTVGGLGWGYAGAYSGAAGLPHVESHQLIVPLWFLVSLTLLWPVGHLMTSLRCYFRQRRCLDLNLCPICGYDLRATPDRCPECGTQTLNKAARQSTI